MEPTKGSVQLPVMSTIIPNTIGEMIAATAEPVFMRPAAVPEYFGAMSIGTDQIGPITSSAKKKPEAEQQRHKCQVPGEEHAGEARRRAEEADHDDAEPGEL